MEKASAPRRDYNTERPWTTRGLARPQHPCFKDASAGLCALRETAPDKSGACAFEPKWCEYLSKALDKSDELVI